MSVASEITRLQQAKAAIKKAIKDYKIPAADLVNLETATLEDYAKIIEAIRPMELSVQTSTLHKTGGSTVSVQSNPHIRIYGSDLKEYTLEEYDALFVAANYDIANMSVQPKGIVIDANGQKSAYLFDRYVGETYYTNGASKTTGTLQHSIVGYTAITTTGSGTDTLTGKGWSVINHPTDNNKLRLTEVNTGCTFDIYKDCGNVYPQKAWNIVERTETLYQLNEWLRHRFAVNSGIETNEVAGTIGEVKILNADGDTLTSASEDMYFFVKNTSDEWVKTSDNRLAKYNLNTQHTGAVQFTQAIADALYNIQKTNGVNMNDSGWASASKPIKSYGMKGAECVSVYDAVSGKNYWYIITPYISSANTAVASTNANMADSPAVYWAKAKGYALPSDTMLKAMYVNLGLCNALRNWLINNQGWSATLLPAFATSTYTWTAIHSTSTVCCYVNIGVGFIDFSTSYGRYYVCGAAALP